MLASQVAVPEVRERLGECGEIVAREREDGAARFVDRDLDYRSVPTGALVDPTPGTPALGSNPPTAALAAAARIYVALYEATLRDRYRERATALLDTVTAAQRRSGGWEHPSSGIPYSESIGTGMVLEALARFRRACSTGRYRSALHAGIEWYRSGFFSSDGRPCVPERGGERPDLTAYAQGAVTFTLAGAVPFGERVVRTALADRYAGSGRLRGRPRRLWGHRRPSVEQRAWMADALATYLDAVRDDWRPQFATR